MKIRGSVNKKRIFYIRTDYLLSVFFSFFSCDKYFLDALCLTRNYQIGGLMTSARQPERRKPEKLMKIKKRHFHNHRKRTRISGFAANKSTRLKNEKNLSLKTIKMIFAACQTNLFCCPFSLKYVFQLNVQTFIGYLTPF